MNKNIGMIFTFIAGVAVGAVSAYKVAETKYRNIANDEIESVVERFSNRQPLKSQDEAATKEAIVDEQEEPTTDRFSINKNRVQDYKTNVDRVGYDTISTETAKPKKGGRKKKVVEAPPLHEDPDIYVISPDEYNTREGFITDTYYFSSDNYVLNSDYEILDAYDIERTIAHDPRGHFGEYEDDAVHIRNERNFCDYEILMSLKTAAEIMED